MYVVFEEIMEIGGILFGNIYGEVEYAIADQNEDRRAKWKEYLALRKLQGICFIHSVSLGLPVGATTKYW